MKSEAQALPMKSIEKLANAIIAREGGFVDDPDDPGGATQHGVTLGALKRLGLDLTGDGQIDRRDVRAVTTQDARRIFIRNYFERPRIGDLPEVLWPSVFDMQVNAGANAVKILQRLLCQMGHDLAVDGRIGPQTIKAAHIAAAVAPVHLADAYGIARRNYYYAIGDRRPASRKFLRRKDGGKGGWVNRAEEFMSPRYRLSADEHAARVAQWA